MEYEVHCDSETSITAEDAGHFQVVALRDENGDNRINLIDQSKLYSSLEELKIDIAAATKSDVNDIDITEI
jgi:type I restriction enzyme S subunit